MDKNTLAQYCDTQTEVRKLQNRLDRLYKQTSIVSDVVQNGYKRHAVITGVDCVRLYKIKAFEEKLQKQLDKLLQQQQDVLDWIESIKESDIRQIIMHRYIDDMSWIQIQIQMRIW
jgi:hypothetical protein